MEELKILTPRNQQMPTPPKNLLDQAVGDDGPTPILSPLSAAPSSPKTVLPSPEPILDTTEQFICFTCRRRLGSQDMLEKHEKFSKLHERNIALLKQASQRRRAEIRNDVFRLRNTSSPERHSGELKKQQDDLGHVQAEFELKNNSLLADSETVSIGSFSLHITGESWTGNKSNNEDRMVLSFQIAPEVYGCLIADGHCGDTCADYLVEHLFSNLSHRLHAELTDESGIRRALSEAFRETDEAFLQYATTNQIPAGSTAIVIVFFLSNTREELRCITAHVGDSRALIALPEVVRLTSDHKPDREDEKRRLQASGGHVVDVGGIWRVFTPSVVSIGGRSLQWGLAVSRAFGDLALKRPVEIVTADPEVSNSQSVPDGAWVVLACDGIFDVLTDQETADACVQGGPSGVVRAAYGNLSDDNLTAVAIKVSKQKDNGKSRPRAASLTSLSAGGGKKRRTTDSEEASSIAPELITPSQLI